MVSPRRWPVAAAGLLIVLTLSLGLLAGDRTHAPTGLIGGPYGRLLAEAVDLGPARVDRVQLTAALGRATRPVELTDWAAARGLAVRWRDGDAWAIIEGPPGAVAGSFNVAVHDYRPRSGPGGGDVFYASPQQPEIPDAARAEAARWLERLRIPSSLWQLPPATFSGGEQQRINIARSFIRTRPLLLLDEPTASLDPLNSATVIELIREARVQQVGIVGIFHDPEVAAAVAPRSVAMQTPSP